MSKLTDLPFWMASHTPFWVKAVLTVIYAVLIFAYYFTENEWLLVAFSALVISTFIEAAIRRERING